MIEVDAKVVQMVGGPLDGDEWSAHARGSLGMPQQMRYFGANKDGACWHTYEALIPAIWEQQGDKIEYHHVRDEPFFRPTQDDAK